MVKAKPWIRSRLVIGRFWVGGWLGGVGWGGWVDTQNPRHKEEPSIFVTDKSKNVVREANCGTTTNERALHDSNGIPMEQGQRQLSTARKDTFADVLIQSSKIEFLRNSQGLMRILGKGAFGQVRQSLHVC